MAPPESDDEPVSLKQRFKWSAEDDAFTYYPPKEGEYSVFNLISEVFQIPFEQMQGELEHKRVILEWMKKLEVENYRDVSRIVRSYYLSPEDIYNLARMDIE
jgi:hypothetical protein